MTNTSNRLNITLIWVSGHMNIEGNEKTNKLSRLGTNDLETKLTKQVKTSLNTIKRDFFNIDC